jgi:hypothetical protein
MQFAEAAAAAAVRIYRTDVEVVAYGIDGRLVGLRMWSN